MHCPYRKQEFQEAFEKSLKAEPPFQENEAQIKGRPLEQGREAVVGLVLTYSPQSHQLRDFLLTQRSDHLTHHPAQVALPGGLVEEGEDALSALDRELFEEVGLREGFVEWVPQHWDPLFSLHGVRVFPYLGFLKDEVLHRAPLRLDPAEVQAADWLSVELLFDENFWERVEGSQKSEKLAQMADFRETRFFRWKGWDEPTWGLTAAFLALFVRRISGRLPC